VPQGNGSPVPSPANNRAASVARTRFAAIAAGPDAAIDLAEACLWLAAESCDDLDVAACLGSLDALAEEVGEPIRRERSLSARVDALNRELFEVRGYRGASDDFYDARSSFLNEVLARRVGIPISLCVLYMEVAKRVGVLVEGISFPGHFLAKAVDHSKATDHAERVVAPAGSDEILIDAFEGRVLSLDECQTRLQRLFGASAVLTPEMLVAATNKQILVRMLSNLKAIYTRQGDYEEALGCCDRSLLLAPGAPLEHRDRGLLFHGLGCPRPALTDLEHYLEQAPDDEGSEAIRGLVATLRHRLPRIH
jgi:regulator of sirC expression with transglutaminase-like and TPR domain